MDMLPTATLGVELGTATRSMKMRFKDVFTTMSSQKEVDAEGKLEWVL